MFNKIMVAFRTNHFIALNRTVPKESFTLMDFIVSCGALLALFMGASLLSFIELVYHFTVQLYLTWWERKKRQRNAIAPQAIHWIIFATINEIHSQRKIRNFFGKKLRIHSAVLLNPEMGLKSPDLILWVENIQRALFHSSEWFTNRFKIAYFLHTSNF